MSTRKAEHVGGPPTGVVWAATALVFAAWALAQYRVNTRVSNRVNPELYGGGTGGAKRYATNTTLLPSEQRYATWRSGALPSEVRMNSLATGPLAPSGSIAYVPGPSPLQQAMRIPQPQLYNPAYAISAATGQKPISTGPIGGQLPNGTIRYNSPAGPAPSAMVSAQPSWTQPLNKATPLPPLTSAATLQPPLIVKPPPASPGSTSPSTTAAEPFYLSRLSTGSIRYSGASAQ